MYDKGDYDTLRHEIVTTNWNELKNDNINIHSSNISNRIVSLADKYIPNKQITIRTSDPPWLNCNICKMIRKRRRLYKKAKQSKNIDVMNAFRHYRNEVTKTTRLAKKSHIDELSHKLKTNNLNSKDWWKTLKSFIKPNTNSAIPPSL